MTAFIQSGDKLSVFLMGVPRTFTLGTIECNNVYDGLKKGLSEEEIVKSINFRKDIRGYVQEQGNERVVYKNGKVYVDGEVLHNAISQRVEKFAEDGIPIINLLKFIENIEQNPSFNSRAQLYNFLMHNCLALTTDGHFLGYKSVRQDFTDHHTGKISNRPGENPKMDRRLIDDNPKTHCSKGLHVGALHYASTFGYNRRLVIVKVNPRDVVCVPDDHNCEKCRVCEYLVLREAEDKLMDAIYSDTGAKYRSTYNYDWTHADDEYEDDYDEDDNVIESSDLEDEDDYSYDDEEDDEDDEDYEDDEDDDFYLPPRIQL